MTAPSQVKHAGAVTYSNMVKAKKNTSNIDPKDLMVEQSKLHLKITKLGSELSKVPLHVDLNQVMEQVE